MPLPSLIIDNKDIRVDEKSGFVNLTDMARLRTEQNASDVLRNWMRNRASIDFFYEWELRQNPNFKTVEFDRFKMEAGTNTFFVTAKDLVNAGATGIYAKAGRYGGTYAHVHWAIHFANWMDPRFYVLTIEAFQKMSDYFQGRRALHHRFARELAAKNYNLITEQNKRLRSGEVFDPNTRNWHPGDRANKQVQRYLNQVDADIINLAVFGITALDWRSRFPQKDPKVNMRSFATQEELLVINALQIELRVLQEDNYTPEEKLHRLRNKAEDLFAFYCDTEEKHHHLKITREKRGW